MLIKVDEDLPGAAADLLREAGHSAMTVREQQMGGMKDPRLWEAVQREQRFLVTGDKGFADTRAHPPGTHAGVLLLRPDADGIVPILNLLRQVLGRLPLEELQRAVSVATPRGVRIRR